jgi:aspartyl-tRNA(Asn)/glutamyl-tRNA(Gln) amidotransferase subunit C
MTQPRCAAIGRAEVVHVARLARLELDDGEIEQMAGELSAVIECVKQIRQLDLGTVQPTWHVSGLEGVTRPDEPWPCLSQTQALAAAPEPVGGASGVPSLAPDEE